MLGFLFSVGGRFTGKNGHSAYHWPKKVMIDLQKTTGEERVISREYHHTIDHLLTSYAEDWLEYHREACGLLDVKEPTKEIVDRFITLSMKKFLARPEDNSRKGLMAEP